MLVVTVQILLAVVFAVAAVGKALDLTGTREALKSFGVPDRAAESGRVVLPIAELAVAIAMVTAPTARVGAAGGLLLLLLFIAAIGSSLRAGLAPDCHCFGQLHSAPAGPGTLVRNAVLGALAALLLVRGPDGAIDDVIGSAGATRVGFAATGLVALVLAGACLELFEEVRRLRAAAAGPKPEGLAIGTLAPDFSALSGSGDAVTLGDLTDRGRPVVLVLVHPGCVACHEYVPRLARWAPSISDSVTLVVVSAGDFEHAPLDGGLDLLTADGFEVAQSYATMTTPAGILVGTDGRIASEPALGGLAIEQLIRSTLSSPTAAL